MGSRRSVSLTERRRACIWWFSHLQFNLKLNSTLFQPNPSFHHKSRFFLPYPYSRLEGFFIDDTYTYDLSVFFLSLPLVGLEDFLSIDPLSRFSFSVSHNWVGRFFHQWHDFLRHISFPTGLGCSHFPPVFLFSLPHKFGRFFTKFSFINRWLPRSTELASKKEGNCNVMVTRPINHMILTRDYSHDLLTWSRHVTYPDIKSTTSHHWYQHSCYHFYVMTTSGFFICHVCATSTSWSLHHCSTRLPPIVDLGQVLGGLPGRLLPDSSGGGMRRGFPQSLLMKTTGRLLSDQRLSRFQ